MKAELNILKMFHKRWNKILFSISEKNELLNPHFICDKQEEIKKNFGENDRLS